MSDDNRQDFILTWLSEAPMGVGNIGASFEQLVYSIRDRIEFGGKVVSLGNGYFKLEGEQVKYYWYGSKDNILAATELQVHSQGLKVNLTGKQNSNQPPYMSDMYDMILRDNKQSIRLVSDDQLSDDGFKLWKRLLNLGHKISVYDRENPGLSFKSFTNISDLEQYFKLHDQKFTRYQFVLSESIEVLGETRSYFNTRRMRELTGLL